MKGEYYERVYNRPYAIYIAACVLALSMGISKKIGAKYRIIDLFAFVSVGLSMGWCIVYLIKYFRKDHVLNVVSTVFWSILGLRIQGIFNNSKKDFEFSDDCNVIEGKYFLNLDLISSSFGIILGLNIMNYTFVAFNLFSTAAAMILSIFVGYQIAINWGAVYK